MSPHRHFRPLSVALVLVAALLLGSVGSAAETGARRQIPLRDGWRFHFGETPGAWQAAFDDQAWEAVAVPHTWNAADSTQPNFKRGQGWYRLHFATPTLAADERVLVDFRAVSLVATVWVNGHAIGKHDNGFAAFRFDITSALNATGDNTLVVLADTTWRDDLPPREGDFTLCGGIYRDASLLITPAVAIEPLDHASAGVYYTTPEITAAQAKLHARVLVRNTLDRPQPLTVRVALSDASGASAGEATVKHVAAPGTTEAVLDLTVPKPHRWHGRRDPYLYSAVATLTPDGDGSAITDSVTQPVGFRTFRIDGERGFILNDEPYDLRGANLHQDRAVRSWAATAADHEEDFRLMCEMGCTFVRLVHYQHDEADYALADRVGIVVWTEHAFVNTASPNPRFAERCATQITELVRQNFNHPSIVFWGIGNEVQTQRVAAAKPLLEMLAREVRLEDPARLSTIATNYGEPFGTYGLDSVAHNKYQGWYGSTPADFAPSLDQQRAKSPGQSIGMSEYGAGAGVSIHREPAMRMDHSEEYQAYFHEVYWRALRDRPWVWSKTVWQMFDAASAGRKEGELNGINDKGLVTRDRKTRKDAFYWYKANWNDEPMVYITSRRFTPRTVATTEVKVYSNCEAVELTLNGKSLGVRAVEDHIVRWPGVALAAGENRLEAVAHRAATTVSDACSWTLAASAP
ncbi:MAG TPA: glycoside hydrolase family 2 TIM barrel-domain containing protein [Opitutaceae bacterium]|nr:glycoside hydrolase family 2 TIM barrel-domain containing protein [Opitutaceae bacterium]